jgi:hypothetical protein
MKTNKLIVFTVLSLAVCLSAFSQEKTVKNDVLTDYKIIASNNSYIEIEYYPKYLNKNNDFYLALNKNKPGEPDLKVRSFSVIFPSSINNTAEILDYRYSEEANIDISPVPHIKPANNKL